MRREPAPGSLAHLSEVILAGERCSVADVPAFAGASVDRLPWVLRPLLENVLRHDRDTRGADAIMDWLAGGSSKAEIAFHPHRLLMHDTTCVPALVDIAAMRSTLAEAGRDPAALDPLLPIDVSVDHSISVDFFAASDALSRNMRREIERNVERYRLLKWAAANLRGLRVYPPGTGIMHTINLERLATVVTTIERDGRRWAIPDTLIGTDSHTPMINGLGVLAWGVGGLEAEGVMFGVPVMFRVPEVVGVRLTGALSEGVLATDLALHVTEQLRKVRLAGTFVEFFGPGVSTLSCGERAVVANMAPEYGSTTGYFPIDARTIDYLGATGRPSVQLRAGRGVREAPAPLVRSAARAALHASDRDRSVRHRHIARRPSTPSGPALAGRLCARCAAGARACRRGRSWPGTATRCARDRGDHELYQYFGSPALGRGGPGGTQGTRVRAHPAEVGEDIDDARLTDRRALPEARRSARGPRGARLWHLRVRLRNLHRQLWRAHAADAARGRAATIVACRCPVRESQLPRPRASASRCGLSRIATIGGHLRACRPDESQCVRGADWIDCRGPGRVSARLVAIGCGDRRCTRGGTRPRRCRRRL